MKEEIDAWRNSTGLSLFKRPDIDPLKVAIDVSNNIDDLNLEEIDMALLVLANYHCFLSSELGKISARVFYFEDLFSTKLDASAASLSAGTVGERKALAIRKYPEISEIKNSLIKEQSKQAMIKPVVDSIKLKIDALKKVYERRGKNVT